RAQGVFLLSLTLCVAASIATDAQRTSKQLIAHRGASGYAPEHTLVSYQLAIVQHADFVEPDLALTRDNVLICLHDDSLERRTEVEQVFPNRFKMDRSGRAPRKRWFANDFTLAEIRRLDAGVWFEPKFIRSRVPTWQDAIDLVRGKAGLYTELKSPEFYKS